MCYSNYFLEFQFFFKLSGSPKYFLSGDSNVLFTELSGDINVLSKEWSGGINVLFINLFISSFDAFSFAMQRRLSASTSSLLPLIVIKSTRIIILYARRAFRLHNVLFTSTTDLLTCKSDDEIIGTVLALSVISVICRMFWSNVNFLRTVSVGLPLCN